MLQISKVESKDTEISEMNEMLHVESGSTAKQSSVVQENDDEEEYGGRKRWNIAVENTRAQTKYMMETVTEAIKTSTCWGHSTCSQNWGETIRPRDKVSVEPDAHIRRAK